MKVKIDSIIVKDGRRAIDEKKVKEMAASIAEIGLLNPIIIDNENVLLAGAHRLEAYKLLGLTEIEATAIGANGLMAELIEIDENYCRSELHYLELGELLSRRKVIYEELHPEAKYGGDRKSEEIKFPNRELDIPSFTADTVAKTGKSRSVIYRELQMANKIIPEVKEVIRASGINRSRAEEISKLEPEEQMAAVRDVTAFKKPERTERQKTEKEVKAFIKQMAKKEPPASDSGKCSDTTIINEFDEIVKEFRAKINKFIYMPFVFAEMTERDKPIQNIISASEDIEKIMGMIKGV